MNISSSLVTESNDQELTVYQRLLMGKGSLLTRRAYSYDLRTFADFLGIKSDNQHPLAKLPNNPKIWARLDPALVAAYLEHLKTTVSPKTGRPYSSATIARHLTAVKELLTEATYLDLYPGNQLAYIKDRISTPQVSNEHHAGLSPEDQATLLRTADQQPGLKGMRDYALFRLWLDTGLRRNELRLLQVRDLVVKEGIDTLIIRHGKRGQIREIGLESYTKYMVEDWLATSDQTEDPTYPIFCQVRKFGRAERAVYKTVDPHKPLSGEALRKLVKWYCRKAGITSKVVPHSFRVAMITDSLDGQAPPQHVQKVTGHTSLDMITQVYDRNQYADPVARYRKKPLPKRNTQANLWGEDDLDAQI